MLKIFFNLLKSLIVLIKYPVYFILVCFALFTLLICINIIIQIAKGKRFKKGSRRRVKRRAFLDVFLLILLSNLLLI